MRFALSFVVQIALILVPVLIFVAVKKKVAGKPARLVFAVGLALSTGMVAYYLATEHGWQPIARGGKVTSLSPLSLAAINAGALMLTFSVLTFAKKQNA